MPCPACDNSGRIPQRVSELCGTCRVRGLAILDRQKANGGEYAYQDAVYFETVARGGPTMAYRLTRSVVEALPAYVTALKTDAAVRARLGAEERGANKLRASRMRAGGGVR